MENKGGMGNAAHLRVEQLPVGDLFGWRLEESRESGSPGLARKEVDVVVVQGRACKNHPMWMVSSADNGCGSAMV